MTRSIAARIANSAFTGITATDVTIVDNIVVSGNVTYNGTEYGPGTNLTQLMDVPPIARAGADVRATLGSAVTFNGAASSDADGTIVLTEEKTAVLADSKKSIKNKKKK